MGEEPPEPGGRDRDAPPPASEPSETSVPARDAGRLASDHAASGFDRRRFLGLIGSAAAVGAAGCQFGGDGTPTPHTPPPSDEVVTVMTSGLPKVYDFGPRLDDPTGIHHLEGFLQSLVLPVDVATGEYYTSGHTWTVDGRDVSVPCLVADFSFEGNDAVRLTFDDRHTYWNDESLDARAYHRRDRARWLANGHAFTEATFGHELVSETEYRRSTDGIAANRFHAHSIVHPGMPPLPPSFNERWIERFESASTVRTVDDRFVEYVQGNMVLADIVDEGYGSGAYVVEGQGDIRRELVNVPGVRLNKTAVYATPRDDHPGTVDVERLRILCGIGTGPVSSAGGPGSAAGGGSGGGGIVGGGGVGGSGGSLQDSLSSPESVLSKGGASLGTGVFGPNGADINPASVPETVEQLATFPNPVRSVTGLVFNWGNEHLRRLWVRRAVVAATPLDEIAANLAGRSERPPPTRTGMLSTVDERVYDDGFLEALHDYPVESDTETAAAWLREAGYERPERQWVGPGGTPIGFVVLGAGQRHMTVASTLEDALESFGIAVEINNVRSPAYRERALAGEFDVAVDRFPAGWSPSNVYGDWFDESGRWQAPSPVTVFGNPLSSCREDDAPASTPGTVTLPAEPGSLRVEGVGYADGGSTYRWPDAGGVDRSVCEATAQLRADDVDREVYDEAARVCARFYNYAVPNLLVAQDRVGLWADTGQLAVPPSGHPSTRLSRFAPVAPEHYHVQAGTIRLADN